MHGRPRRPPKAADAASIAKAERLCSLQADFLRSHQNQIYTREALETSSKLLQINPEAYTTWNYRKIAVSRLLESETDHDKIKSILDEELRVVENALWQNPKSYGAWHHRKWVISKGFSSLDHEFKLLNELLKKDTRNFHGWNYRRFLAALKNATYEEELEYMTDKINKSISNYSAWHNRRHIFSLPLFNHYDLKWNVIKSNLLKQEAEGHLSKEQTLAGEFELVDGAIFTDPDDQSAWFYHLWLLDETTQSDIPILTASWPPPGSNLTLAADAELGVYVSSPYKCFFPRQGDFPLLLHFNQPVEMISNSVVTVKCMALKNENLVWRPLSTSNMEKAISWITYLSFPDEFLNNQNVYTVEVALRHPLGVMCSETQYSSPAQFEFTLNFQSIDITGIKGESSIQMVNWEDDQFHKIGSTDELFTPFGFPFDQIRGGTSIPITSNWQRNSLENEITCFHCLSSSCKIGKLTLARLLMAHDVMVNGIHSKNQMTHSEEVLELLDELQQSDTPHTKHYKDQHSLVFLDQVTSNRDALTKHFWHHKSLARSNLEQNVCLRLNKLSISQIGFFEHLSWIQMLDLSHNELQNIEGLEVLQLLTCLNLSHNKLKSFTALDPLRLLKLLRVLDISNNEIGAHSIDTTRYLCCSPLSNGRGCEMNMEELANDKLHVVHSWELLLMFKDLPLIQLDMAGNPSYDEKCEMLLEKIIPSLKWLNGVSVN
ncbi:Geranylgeranyl transferase type-2 subunit alpha [Nymphaea thermarum]|nr:Geranylgeranyl transferase type-2 subunit alpha [Nymphaea thermarum]